VFFGARKYWKPNRITQETTIARMRFFCWSIDQ
jgi:hypothetical protein